jgi:hypothetical protein
MITIKNLLATGPLAAFCILGLTHCGGNDNDDPVDVKEISAQDSALTVAQKTVVKVDFSFSADRVFDHDKTAYIVLQLPANLTFQRNSAEIQRLFDDNRVSPQVTDCSDGTTYLAFNFDDRDLVDATNPSGDADARVNFTVNAVSSGGDIIISGEGSEDPIDTVCGRSLDEEAVAAVTIR